MSETKAQATELTSQYIAQVTSDLERNAKEQERISAEIEALQEQLGALQHDHGVLVNMQQALGTVGPVVEADTTTAAPSVPHQASPEPKQSKPKKAAVAASSKKTASKKPAAEAAPVKVSDKTAAKPTLVDLIRGHLEKQSEPRSAAEIATALTQAHPDRSVKTTVVRTTLEGLVAKSHAQRSKQGTSVFYTAAATSESAAPEPQQEAAAG